MRWEIYRKILGWSSLMVAIIVVFCYATFKIKFFAPPLIAIAFTICLGLIFSIGGLIKNLAIICEGDVEWLSDSYIDELLEKTSGGLLRWIRTGIFDYQCQITQKDGDKDTIFVLYCSDFYFLFTELVKVKRSKDNGELDDIAGINVGLQGNILMREIRDQFLRRQTGR